MRYSGELVKFPHICSTKENMLKISAKVISYIMHPLFLLGYVLVFLMQANRYLFSFSNDKAMGLVLITILTIAIMFPLLSLLIMKALGLIKSFEMEDKFDRILPLIITGLFYLWLYVNIRKNDNIPGVFTFFVLGCTIAIFLALIINNFSKVSLHTIGAGGFVAIIAAITFQWTYGFTDLPIPFTGIVLRMSDRLVLMIAILLAGVVGTARLYLKAHKPEEVYGGYIVGILSQMAAYLIVF
ncbi:MAG: hypothetical protein LC107_08400 [Chitinophagales bacterium]|nr:hypothetical protein [Chitinophagales bacterium]